MRLHKAGYKAVVITAKDTDVLVLCLAFNKDTPCPVYQKCGTQTRTRFLDVDKLTRSMGGSVCDVLVGLHVSSGCGTVSAFVVWGRTDAVKQMKLDKTYKRPSVSSVIHGKYPPSSFRSCKRSPATFTCRLLTSRKSMNSDINFSVPDGEKQSPVSFHHVKTASSCTSSVHTIRLLFGGAVCNANPMFQVPRVGDGPLMMTGSWPSSGCTVLQHRMQCCNCFPASVNGHANSQTACALPIA